MTSTNATRRRDATDVARDKAVAVRHESIVRARRRRMGIIVGSAVGVLAVVAVIVVIGVSGGSGAKNVPTSRTDATGIAATVATVPASTLAAIGPGTSSVPPRVVSDPALTAGGHPLVLYVGAEYCPYCAASRWAFVQSLSRFGTFSGLTIVKSSPTDQFPNTPTFSFVGSTYTSDYVSFTGRELATRSGAPLEKLTPAEDALWKKYTGPGSFPFYDIGGKYVGMGAGYNPQVLHGLTAGQIAAQLADASSPIAKGVDGSANVITAAICATTGNSPSSVCTAPGVVAAAAQLGG